MDVKLLVQCISSETIFKINEKLTNNYNTIYIINRQKTPVFCLFNDRYFINLKNQINKFFDIGIYTTSIYINNYIDYNITWSQIELDIFSLEYDLLNIKFKHSDHTLILFSTYFLNLIENAYNLENNIKNYLINLEQKNENINRYYFSKINKFYYNLFSEKIQNKTDLKELLDLYIYNDEIDKFYELHEKTSSLYNSLKTYNILLGKYYNYTKYDKSYNVLMKKIENQ